MIGIGDIGAGELDVHDKAVAAGAEIDIGKAVFVGVAGFEPAAAGFAVAAGLEAEHLVDGFNEEPVVGADDMGRVFRVELADPEFHVLADVVGEAFGIADKFLDAVVIEVDKAIVFADADIGHGEDDGIVFEKAIGFIGIGPGAVDVIIGLWQDGGRFPVEEEELGAAVAVKVFTVNAAAVVAVTEFDAGFHVLFFVDHEFDGELDTVGFEGRCDLDDGEMVEGIAFVVDGEFALAVVVKVAGVGIVFGTEGFVTLSGGHVIPGHGPFPGIGKELGGAGGVLEDADGRNMSRTGGNGDGVLMDEFIGAVAVAVGTMGRAFVGEEIAGGVKVIDVPAIDVRVVAVGFVDIAAEGVLVFGVEFEVAVAVKIEPGFRVVKAMGYGHIAGDGFVGVRQTCGRRPGQLPFHVVFVFCPRERRDNQNEDKK